MAIMEEFEKETHVGWVFGGEVEQGAVVFDGFGEPTGVLCEEGSRDGMLLSVWADVEGYGGVGSGVRERRGAFHG